MSLVAAVVVMAALDAAGPIFWQVSTRTDLLKGEVDKLAIDSDGRLLLGPAMAVVADTDQPFIWTMVVGGDGAIYAGTGNDGKVLRIGRPPADSKPTTFFDAPELEVHALASSPDGGLFVGTSPDGKVYHVDKAGRARVFFDPGDKYIWSLALDQSANLFVGTGPTGVIYRVAPDGKGAAFSRTSTMHVVTLVTDRGGRLLAGTDSPGRVLRLAADGKASVLLQTAFREVRAISTTAAGPIYVAAVNGTKVPEERPGAAAVEPPKPAAVPSVSAEITAISIIDVGTTSTTELRPGTAPTAPTRASKGAVYRIDPDGTWDVVWELADDTPYDLDLDDDGSVLVATGAQGRLFRITGDPPRVTLLGRAPAQQVTRWLPVAGAGRLAATANPGKLIRVGPGRTEQGTYESDIRDTDTVSTWGTISWRASVPGGARVEVYTRSGNTDRPDDTWSPWAGPYRNRDGDQILSPTARYLQWKAVLIGTGDSPVLTSVTAAYLQRNLRPKVTSITVHPPGVVFQKPYSTGELEIAGFEESTPEPRPGVGQAPATAIAASAGPALGRRIYQKGLQTFQWKGEDPNDDRLRYDVLYRREDGTAWKTLKRALSEPLFVWDTTTVPGGTYLVRIVASDAPSNRAETALTGDLDSTTFDVDNTPPAIRIGAVRREGHRTVVTFEVSDDQSVVQRVDYSIDAAEWQRIYPTDGLSDSRFERFELVVEGDAAARTIVLRAVDSMNNVSTIRADGSVPRTGPDSAPLPARGREPEA